MSDTHTSLSKELHFRDARPPHEIQFLLEGRFRTFFSPVPGSQPLTLQASLNEFGVAYTFSLRFDAALQFTNCYSLRREAAWPDQPSERFARLVCQKVDVGVLHTPFVLLSTSVLFCHKHSFPCLFPP